MLNICKTYDSPVWKKFIKDPDGAWYNEKMENEKNRRINYSASRRCTKMKEYEKKHMTGHMSRHMSGHMETETETIGNNVVNNSTSISTSVSNSTNLKATFDLIWLRYPDKDGKKAALRSFLKDVKTPEDLVRINRALDNYLGSKRVKSGYIKAGSTWFNNWQDWLNFVEPKSEEEISKEIDKKIFR
jgi:hypothetical protein